MILNYKFRNFMSFADDAEFSMLAPSTKVKNRFPDNYNTQQNGYNILKTAVIVGENAGGKTNFVTSLDFFKSLFFSSDRVTSERVLTNTNNLKGNCRIYSDTTQFFEIELTDNADTIYKYSVEFDVFGIINEKLFFKKDKAQEYKLVMEATRILENLKCNEDGPNCDKKECHIRGNGNYKLQVIDIGKEIRKSLEEAAKVEEPLGLFVTKIAILGNPIAIKFINLVKNDICPVSNSINYDLYKSLRKEREDLEILEKEEFFDIFNMIDYSIKKIEVNQEDPFTKSKIYRKNAKGEYFVKELAMDSSGVREFFAWAIQIYRVVYENKVVFADEMDRVLNPVLSDRVISFINGKKHNGQFVFTSHNVLHLDLKTYMKEQIYFISKDSENLNSELYSLADFPEVRYETTKIYEFYMKGILGGTAVE